MSDVKITKPVNGIATAVFTVTLTGYATTKEGAPIPVGVEYATKEVSATNTNNFVPVKGKLAFTPSRGATDRYLIKQDIEVPIKAKHGRIVKLIRKCRPRPQHKKQNTFSHYKFTELNLG